MWLLILQQRLRTATRPNWWERYWWAVQDSNQHLNVISTTCRSAD